MKILSIIAAKLMTAIPFLLYVLTAEANTYSFKLSGGNGTVVIEMDSPVDEAITIENGIITFNSDADISVFSENTTISLSDIYILNELASSINNINEHDEGYILPGQPLMTIFFVGGYSTELGQNNGNSLTFNLIDKKIQPGACLVSDCGESACSSNTGYLSQHMNSSHEDFTEGLALMLNASVVLCPICWFQINSRQALLRHVRDFHPMHRISIKTPNQKSTRLLRSS